MKRQPHERGGVERSKELVRVGLTPAFSGAANGIAGNHMNCASWPPLERVVRLPCFDRTFLVRVAVQLLYRLSHQSSSSLLILHTPQNSLLCNILSVHHYKYLQLEAFLREREIV